MADVWTRLIPTLPPAHRQPMRQAVLESWLPSQLWEVDHHVDRRTPDPVDYLEMARKTFGSDFLLAFAMFEHPDIPPDLYDTAELRNLANATADYMRLLNDLLSYQKETEFEGEFLNAVVVFHEFLRCDLDTATRVVRDILASRVAQFQHIATHELPALCEHRGLSPAVRAALTGYVSNLETWMAGVHNWHHHTNRYPRAAAEARWRRIRCRRLTRPAGPGASAALLVTTERQETR